MTAYVTTTLFTIKSSLSPNSKTQRLGFRGSHPGNLLWPWLNLVNRFGGVLLVATKGKLQLWLVPLTLYIFFHILRFASYLHSFHFSMAGFCFSHPGFSENSPCWLDLANRFGDVLLLVSTNGNLHSWLADELLASAVTFGSCANISILFSQ